MVKKSFITDCEGPLSLNDNAYELCAHFISEGDILFKILSKFDDYLIEIAKRPNYNAGDTLKFLALFLKAYGLTNNDLIKFSEDNIAMVPGAADTLELANFSLDSYIVSTSYGQYIKALTNTVNFPYGNTYHTTMDLDSVGNILDSEKNIIMGFKEEIINNYTDILNPNSKNIEDSLNSLKSYDFSLIESILFDKVSKMKIGSLIKNTKTVGGQGKKLAVKDIVSKLNLDLNGIMYVGDSITDVEPLGFVKKNKGISVSFNGNDFAINAAEVAIISDNTILTSMLIDLHSHFNTDYVLNFVKAYNNNPKSALENYRIKFHLIDKFAELYKGKDKPIMTIITDQNKEELLEKSLTMRKNIRGNSIGALG